MDEYIDCKLSELYFGPTTQLDEDLIKKHVGSNKISLVLSLVVMALTIYMVIGGVIGLVRNDTNQGVMLFIIAIGVLGTFFVYRCAFPKAFVAEGVAKGRLESCHHETHRRGDNKGFINTYYGEVVFDGINRRVRLMEIPSIKEKVSAGASIDKTPEIGTLVNVYKIKNGHYAIIYPKLYDKHIVFHIGDK